MPLFHSVAFPQTLGYSCFPAHLCFGNLCLFWKNDFGHKIITVKEHHQWGVMAVGLLPTLSVSLNSSGHVPDSQAQIGPLTAPAWGKVPCYEPLSMSTGKLGVAGQGLATPAALDAASQPAPAPPCPVMPCGLLCQPKPV